jgi:hypothetical protein
VDIDITVTVALGNGGTQFVFKDFTPITFSNNSGISWSEVPVENRPISVSIVLFEIE